MNFRVPCVDRNTGAAYLVAIEARSAEHAAQLASLRGHLVREDHPEGGAPSVERAIASVEPVRGSGVMQIGASPARGANRPADARAIASLCCGATSIVGSIVPPVGVLLGLIGLVLGLRSSTPGSALRTAGITTSAIGIVASMGWMVVIWLVSPTV